MRGGFSVLVVVRELLPAWIRGRSETMRRAQTE